MKYSWLFWLIVGGMLLLGCANEAVPHQEPQAPQGQGPARRTQMQTLPNRCRVASEAQTSYVHLEGAFCWRYPADYELVTGGRQQVVWQGPAIRDGQGQILGRGLTLAITMSATELSLEKWLEQSGLVAVAPQLPEQLTVGGRPAQWWYGLPGEDTPGEDTPGEDTPGEDTPGEDTPGEDTPGEDMSMRVDYLFIRGEKMIYQVAIAYPLLPTLDLKGDALALGRVVTSSFTPLAWGFLRYYQACPESTAVAASYVNVVDGYCFLVPAGMTLGVNQTLRTVFLSQSLGGDEPMSLAIHAGGTTTAGVTAVADAYLADMMPSWAQQVVVTEAVLAARPMVVLDGTPGRWRARQTFVVRDGRIYAMTMMPYEDEQWLAAQPLIASQWAAVVQSWQFVPLLQEGD